MDRPEKSETYRGHKLKASAEEVRPGWWSWSYLIDDTISGRSTAGSLLQDAEAAVRRALMAARARADGLTS